MKVFPRVPAGSVRNADMFGKSKLKKGERVLDTLLDVENMPPIGKLVVAESNVVMMAKTLKYGVRTPAEEELLQAELESLRALAKELGAVREALANV